MRPLWQGSISFGLVHIPVKIFTALEDRSIKFRFLHGECHTPLSYERKCPRCDRAVSMEEVVRAYEYEKGRFVIMEEELLKTPGESLHTVEIMDFVRLEEIDPIYFAKPYYLAPGLGGEKAYYLLHRTMHEKGQVAIAKTRLRNKESLVALRVFQQALLMSQMFYHDEIRPVDLVLSPDNKVELNAAEIKMASELIGNLTGSFQPEKYYDQYRKSLEAAIAAKIAGEEIAIAPAAPAAKVVDLVEALKASLEMTNKQGKGKGKGKKRKKEAVAGRS